MINRCKWAGDNELMIDYHDTEWGTPLYEDQQLFEFLCLEGAQAGLSWQTILNKRENYREAFDNFDADKISKYDDNKIDDLLQNKGIIRNRGKINAFINNAKIYIELQQEYGSFSKYIWQFVDKPIINKFNNMSEIFDKTEISEKMSRDLKKHGFKFIGPTICYAFMQATGMVNDHTTDCFKYKSFNQVNQ